VIAAPVTPATLETWAATFAQEFAGAGVCHVRLEWTGPDPDPAERAAYAAAGYEFQTSLCMVLEPPPPVPAPALAALEVRSFGPADQEAMRAFLHACHPDWGVGFMNFTVGNMRLRQGVVEGDWWLGLLDGQIAGSMGLYFDGALGRFQLVDTHPAYRRRGVARTLLQGLIRTGLARPATRRLVISADRDYFAADLYAACGFRTVHTQYELFKPPTRD